MYVTLPSRTLYSDEIFELVKKCNVENFRGCFMKDELKRLGTPFNSESGIVNLNNHTQNGSHWICYAKINDDLFYFDSFGMYPTDEVLRYLKTKKEYRENLPRIKYNIEIVQHFTSQECGALCIYMITQLCQKHRAFTDIIEELKTRYNSNKPSKLKIKV
jgi:hypothetical protein